MLGQTFSIVDLPLIFSLTFLEGILSVDNALILALIIKKLPLHLRGRALFIGLSSSIVLRGLGIVSAAYLIQLNWLKLWGGLYLLYVSLSHFFGSKKTASLSSDIYSFWAVVALIEGIDFIFAIDSILAGVALVQTAFPQSLFSSKLWIVYFGGLSGLILIRFGVALFARILDRFPRLETGAHLIVGWIGVNLILKFFYPTVPFWADALILIGVAGCLAFGFIKK